MPKTKIVIAGGGFAGISALKTLSRRSVRSKNSLEITIIDKKPYSEFLPMLPDVAGGWLRPELLRTDLRRVAASAGAVFAREEITELDTAAGSVKTREREFPYDILILATGSETNFYSNDELSRKCLKLDTVEDAVSIREKVLQRSKSGEVNIVISGAGYTGVELASNLDILLKGKGVQHSVSIVEKADEALMMLPEWVRREVMEELGKMGIEILTGTSIREYDAGTVVLSSGEKVDNALCVWAAGVKTPSYIEVSSLHKERSRILVEEDLTPSGLAEKNIFVAGDSAYFNHTADGKPLRMAVMFALAEGKVAALNALRSLEGKALKAYRPMDLGYLLPVASGKAPGVVLGKGAHGALGYMMHYFMCVYRSSPAKMAGILMDIARKFRNKREGGNSWKR